ncbi:MAG: hypothetical protein JO117_00285, partial [Verrucomicrobia bacterium]|nr:hypothetical protein [Verrucomicrobiota bacterium]
MPDQPPTLDERLRAAALTRAAEFDAGGDESKRMPATLRARLHEEIRHRRRVSAASEATPTAWSFARAFVSFWPRFAVVAAILALAALVVLPHGQRRESDALADHRTDAVAAATPPATLTPPAPPQPLPTLAPREETPRIAEAAPPAVAAASSQANGAAADVAQNDAALRGGSNEISGGITLRQNFSRNADVSSTTSMPAAGAMTATRSRNRDDRRVAAAPAKPTTTAAGVPEVLSNFRLEQTGDRIRVVDFDGSVYAGEIRPLAAGELANVASQSQRAAPTKDASQADKANASAATATNAGGDGAERNKTTAAFAKRRAPDLDASPPQETRPTPAISNPTTANAPTQAPGAQAQNRGAAFSFRAAGANRSLREPVVFEGTYFAAPG